MAFTAFGRTIGKVGVIGSGNIGPDIALHFSQKLHSYGVPVVVVDIEQFALDQGSNKAKMKMAKAAEKGLYKKEEADAIFQNMLFTNDYENLSDVDFLVEAAVERLDVKQKIFDQCDKICPKTAILSSNTSTIIPEEIFLNVEDKSRCLVLHYFFPAERNRMVEVVPGKDTNSDLTNYLMKLYEFIGKAPILVKGRFGFAVNPVFGGVFLASAFAVEKGLGSVKQVDAIAAKVFGMGIGPFTAQNLSGGHLLTHHLMPEMGKNIMPWYRCPKILDDLVKSGGDWDTPKRGEEVEYNPDMYEAVSREIMGAYFGLACEIIESGITGISDLELGIQIGLAMTPPFQMMNQLGVKKASELVDTYCKENPGFKVGDILQKQVAEGKPWKIPVVLREDREKVAVVKIRRPTVMNALNEEVMNQLEEVFTDIKKNSGINGAVLTGFGRKAFVSGADIEMLSSLKTPNEAEKLSLRGQAVLNLIENLGKPVVCAMNGLAFGGGNEIAMACTARIAQKGQKAFIAQPEPRLGIIPGSGGTQRLPRLVGLEKAWPILRSGNPISSAKAREIGLINEEVDGDQLIKVAIDWIKKILSGELQQISIQKDTIPIPATLPEVDIGPLSRKTDSLIQRAILEGAKMTLDEGFKLEAKIFGECLLTQDMRIGMETFMKTGGRAEPEFVHA